MALTREEAIEKAKKINPRVNRAIEYKDAFGFENTKAGMQFGGNEGFVILKESGDTITVTQYMYRKDHDSNPKRIPMSNKVKRPKK